MVKVLFVCLGNICRSPTAEGVFARMVTEADLDEVISVDSAGTHAYHVGEAPDRRAQQTARSRGYDLSSLRARQAGRADFHEFDYVLAMDRDNLEILGTLCPTGMESKLRLFMSFAPDHPAEVPDPYYGGARGFEQVFDMVEEASRGLLDSIRSEHLQ